MNYKRIIIFWGILDLCSIGWYSLWRILHGQLPFYSDILFSINTTGSFGYPLPIVMTIISLLLYLSLIPSGYLLSMQKSTASTVAYLQTPFRLIGLILPSVFFIIWPLKYIFEDRESFLAIVTLIILLLLSESLKICSVFFWRKQIGVA